MDDSTCIRHNTASPMEATNVLARSRFKGVADLLEIPRTAIWMNQPEMVIAVKVVELVWIVSLVATFFNLRAIPTPRRARD
jgi:hypothetical protein